ncbi:hypothetical protein N2152v2_010361 [Parachlorella kessleri]
MDTSYLQSRLKEDWGAFYTLLSNDKGVRVRLNIPDTVVLELGQPIAWFYTSKEGYVQRQPPGRTTLGEIRQYFLRYAPAIGSTYNSKHVAILRLADGTPKVLGRQEFEEVCDRLEEQLASGECDEDTPCVLQAFVPPFLDLRYVTSYTNDGVEVACQTFQRRFSRRYLPYKSSMQSLQPGMLSGDAATPGLEAAADGDAPADEVSDRTSGAPAALATGGAEAEDMQVIAIDTAGLLDAAAEGAEVQLDDATLADMERTLGKTLGPVDPSLKMQVRKAAQNLVFYIQKARGLTLRSLICEFVRDAAGEVYFIGHLRTDWASLIPECGGEPWANANLMQRAREVSSDGSDAGAYTVTLTEQGGGGMTIIDETTTTSVTVVGPSGERETRDGSPPQVVITEVDPMQQADSPRIAALRSPPALGSSPTGGEASRKSPGHSAASGSPKMALVPRGPNRSPGAVMPVRTLQTVYGEWHHSNDGGRKGAVQLTSQLTKELLNLQDDLTLKTELAETLAAKVEALEHDKHVITDAFERVVTDLQKDLQEVQARMAVLRSERDALAAQVGDAQRRAVEAEAERDECRLRLDGERGTVMTSLGAFQQKQDEAVAKAAVAERELQALQERFREEQVAYDALKKQMVFYQHTLSAAGLRQQRDSFAAKDPQASARAQRGDPLGAANPALALLRGNNNPEIKFWETLNAVEELLNREADPDGERYALAKVLHTCQGDLHAIFLYYCLIDTTFTRYWPPQLTMTGWMAFVKEIGITNLVPGTRTRTEATIPVADTQEIFKKYCARQALMSSVGGATLARTASIMRPGSASNTPAGRPGTTASTPAAAATATPNGTLSFEGFCAVLVYIAARLARASPDGLADNPFLSEQARGFIEDIAPRAQRVTTLSGPVSRKGFGGAGAASAGKQAKAAAEKTNEKLPKLKKDKNRLSGAGGKGTGAMRVIAEASKEGSSAGSS